MDRVQLDYASHSSYPGAPHETAAEVGVRIDLLKAVTPGKEVWVAEFQGVLLLITYSGAASNLRPKSIRSSVMAAAHSSFIAGSRCCAGPEPRINGMVEPDTYDTERRAAAQRVIAELRQHEHLMARGDDGGAACRH